MAEKYIKEMERAGMEVKREDTTLAVVIEGLLTFDLSDPFLTKIKHMDIDLSKHDEFVAKPESMEIDLTKYKDDAKYKELVMKLANDAAEQYGGVRKAAKELGMSPASLCRIRSGKRIPDIRTLIKWFPGLTANVVINDI